jgi:hypothetical protein
MPGAGICEVEVYSRVLSGREKPHQLGERSQLGEGECPPQRSEGFVSFPVAMELGDQ